MDNERFNIPTSTPSNPKRWDASGLSVGVPEITLIGHESKTFADPLPAHHHYNAYEFHFVERGVITFQVGAQTFDVYPGQVFHTRPYELHSGTNSIMGPAQFWWIILKCPDESIRPFEWLSLRPDDHQLLVRKLNHLPRVFEPSGSLTPIFTRIRGAFAASNDLHILAVRIAVVDLLLSFLEEQHREPVAAFSLDPLVEISQKLSQNLSVRPSIDSLAKSINMSVSFFYKRFTERFGLSPILFWNRERLKRASILLLNGDDSITRIATDLGYASSQQFATAFKQMFGYSPSTWRSNVLRIREKLK